VRCNQSKGKNGKTIHSRGINKQLVTKDGGEGANHRGEDAFLDHRKGIQQSDAVSGNPAKVNPDDPVVGKKGTKGRNSVRRVNRHRG